MISDAQGVGHDGQRRVHRPGGWEEAGIDHVQVVQVVRLAVCVQHRRLGIVSEAACAILVGHAGQRDPLAYVGIHVQQIFCAVDVLQQALELGLKPAVALKIARRVAQHDPTLPCEGDPVFRIRQVFRRQPEIERVLGHQLERESGHDFGRPGGKNVGIRLTDKRDVTHGVFPVRGAKVEIVQPERLLEHRGVGASGDCEHHRVQMAHVVPPDLVGTVGQPGWMSFVGGAQEQGGRVDGAAGDDDDVGGKGLFLAISFDVNLGHFAARVTGLQARDIRIGEQRDVRLLERRVHADDLRVGLGIYETGMPVAPRAPNTLAFVPVLFVKHDAHGQQKRMVPDALEVIAQLLDPRLVADRRIEIGRARRRFGRVDTAPAVHLI